MLQMCRPTIIAEMLSEIESINSVEIKPNMLTLILTFQRMFIGPATLLVSSLERMQGTSNVGVEFLYEIKNFSAEI